MSNISIQGAATGTGVFTLASPATNTDRTLVLPDEDGAIVAKSGSYVTPSDLGSGTPDATNFLRGDGSWQVITPEQVLSATAGASAGDVGTYGFFYITNYNVTITTGSTRAGSGLVWTSLYVSPTGGGTWSVGGSGSPSGTWRCMGHINAFNNAGLLGTTLWLRIS